MKKTSLTLFLCFLFQTNLFAGTVDSDVTDAVKAVVKKILPTTTPDSITASPVSGLYEVIVGAKVLYISADGKFLLEGDLFDLKNMKNLTESKRTIGRLKAVNGIDEKSMIIFSPEKVKYRLTVFTDIDCGYCRKMHREMDAYMEEGIEIRYLAYPRSGVNTKSYYKAVNVWCSEDKKDALTKAKNGEKLPKGKCDNPVKSHMAVADVVGVTGTPTLVFDDGNVVPGYLPAKRLAAFFESRKKK